MSHREQQARGRGGDQRQYPRVSKGDQTGVEGPPHRNFDAKYRSQDGDKVKEDELTVVGQPDLRDEIARSKYEQGLPDDEQGDRSE